MQKLWESTLTKLVSTSVAIGLFWLSVSSYADTNSGVFNFTAIFVGGTCDITVPKDVQFNDGNILYPTDIKNEVAATTKSFQLVLSNCSGWGLTPSIKVSGRTTNEFGEDELFSDQIGPNAANGYGVLLTTTGNDSFSANSNLAKNGKIAALNWNTNSQLNTLSRTIPMVAKLTCGSCNYSGRRSGEFQASVTFEFIYD